MLFMMKIVYVKEEVMTFSIFVGVPMLAIRNGPCLVKQRKELQSININDTSKRFYDGELLEGRCSNCFEDQLNVTGIDAMQRRVTPPLCRVEGDLHIVQR